MNLNKPKTWINENSIEIQSGIKVISVTPVLKKIEEIEEAKDK